MKPRFFVVVLIFGYNHTRVEFLDDCDKLILADAGGLDSSAALRPPISSDLLFLL